MQRTFFIFFLLVTLASCQKDQDTETPSVRITAPTSSSFIRSFEQTLSIQADVSDNQSLSRYLITVKGQQTGYTLLSDAANIDGTSFLLSRSYLLDDVRAPTDDYLITIRVEDDAGNERSDFQQFQYFGAPRELVNIGVVASDGNTCNIYVLSTEFQLVNTLSNPVSAIGFSDYHQELLLGIADQPLIHVIDPETWNVSATFGNGTTIADDFVRDFHSDGSKQYVALFDERVIQLNASGQTGINYQLPQNHRPEEVCSNENWIICSAKVVGSNQNTLVFFNKQTGVFQGSSNVAFEILGIETYEDQFLVVGENEIGLFNPTTNSYNEQPWLIAGQTVNAIAKANLGFYAIAHPDGVYHYRFSDGSIIFPSSNMNADDLVFDDLNGVTYALNGSEIQALNWQNGEVIASYIAPSNARHLFLHFNK